MSVDPAAIPTGTRAAQARAADPSASAWVSANAGSGKTHVLTERVIRLLLAGTDPARILCVTYTKAAAANMANRLFARLGAWTVMDDGDLRAALQSTLGRAPTAAETVQARRLFARALETPGGLKIQTIHAFCEAILHQFPLEANIAGHFELMDEKTAALLASSATRNLLVPQPGEDRQALDKAVSEVLTLGGEHGLGALVDAVIAERDGLKRFIEHLHVEADDEQAPGFPALYTLNGVSPDTGEADIAASVWPLAGFSRAEVGEIADTFERHGGGRAETTVDALLAAHATQDATPRFAHLCDAFLTKTGTIRALPFKKAVTAELPALEDDFADAAQVVLEAADRLAFWRMLKATESALVVADHLIARYEAGKRARGLLDFDDLIERTVALLARADVGPWVHYKLDKGIDHILIDEAQDTSPRQWAVLTSLAEEFFAGKTASPKIRTVFAVGDEKQSIYSFQGARPESFYVQHRHFETKSIEADIPFHAERLDLSFRSTADVLQAVDLVFRDPAAHRGLTQEPEPTVHEALEGKGPGEVQAWPVVAPADAGDERDWTAPVDHASEPAIVLAGRIAAVIAGWIHTGEVLEAKGRAVRAGDIMVLVRKRGPFIRALSRKLKELGIAVAGTDRIRLAEHIAVMDLMALGRVCLQPADDLSLAALLRSPLFDVSEEDLARIAIGRPAGETLWRTLRRHAEGDASLAAIVEQLDDWRARAGVQPVFDFYAGILARDGARAKLVARLGREADDLIDEFLKFALAEERTGPPGLDVFLHTMETIAPEIKREMDQARDEVRIMTAHAAKGLEAPVVFLVDPGSAVVEPRHLPVLIPVERSPQDVRGYFWRVPRENSSERDLLDSGLKQRMEDEYRRLLYVGMTRAEDRLVVCGYRGLRENPGTWLSMVQAGLEGAGEMKTDDALGFDYLRFAPSPRTPVVRSEKTDARKRAAQPALIRTDRARPEAGPPRPLAPSGASLLVEAMDAVSAEASGSPVLDTREVAPSRAIERGTAVHKLLQTLPGVDPAERAAAAERYLAARLAEWNDADRAALAAEALAVLGDPRFAPVFAPSSRAEVPVMGMLEVAGEMRAVSGVIDRIAVEAERVLIVDYKTNRPPPAALAEVPREYLAQMAIYRALFKPLYPQKDIEVALLFTAAPHIVAVPGNVMDAALASIVAR